MAERINLDISYEELQQNMLNRIPNQFDKREGMPIFTSIAPTAIELQNVYIHLKYILNEFFIETASREYLVLRAAERGLSPHESTKAIWKAVFNINVPIGSRFSLDSLNFVVIKQIAPGEFLLECESTGDEGNSFSGTLIPIEYINGLEMAELTELVQAGEDEEGTESFRERYLESVRLPSTSGNKAHYKIWAREVSGVGDVKVFPTWSGPGTVKVAIIDMNKRAADKELVASVYTHIEEIRPIGATVTVVSGQEKAISVSAKVVLANGFTIGQVQMAFEQLLINRFAEIAFKETYVSYARIGNLLLDVPGVGDYTDLKVNGGTANILLADEEIPVLNTVTLGV